jgi:uncharacterized protein
MLKNIHPLILKIAQLWTSAEGTVVKHDLDAKLDFDPREINALSNFTGELMLIKLKDEISVIITNASVSVGFSCTKCFKEFVTDVSISAAEREFYAKTPPEADDPSDIFLIAMKDLTIDLSEMIRQEIILHFPFIAVCSTGCKGLCQHCGKDRNIRPCSCKAEDPDLHKPFRDIKKLLK